jgi:hypothetical protein
MRQYAFSSRLSRDTRIALGQFLGQRPRLEGYCRAAKVRQRRILKFVGVVGGRALKVYGFKFAFFVDRSHMAFQSSSVGRARSRTIP